jgi:5'-3' exonuclease
MAQPIRKIIKDEHPDLITEKPFYTLLVDGNSVLFHSFADNLINSEGYHIGGLTQFLLQLKMMLSKRDFSYVYVTFDEEYSGYLRWQLYNDYKQNRFKRYYRVDDDVRSDYQQQVDDTLRKMRYHIYNKNTTQTRWKSQMSFETLVCTNFLRERDLLRKYFEELYIRVLIDETTEGDDFIAYYCKHKKPNEKIYIMSGDMDITQLISDDIAVYEMHKKKFITKDNFKENFGYHYKNVAVKKIFCGDTSDNIGNIKGMSENAFAKLIPEYTSRPVTVDEVINRAKELIEERKNEKKKPIKLHENIVNGVSNKKYDGDFYEINKKLIDLSEPILSDSGKELIDSMMYAPIDPHGRSFSNLYKYILEDGIDIWQDDMKFTNFFTTFKRLEEKEVQRYKEAVKNGDIEEIDYSQETPDTDTLERAHFENKI